MVQRVQVQRACVCACMRFWVCAHVILADGGLSEQTDSQRGDWREKTSASLLVSTVLPATKQPTEKRREVPFRVFFPHLPSKVQPV